MKAIFLDRDGVINKYPGDTKWVTNWQEFKFLPRAKGALRKLYENGYKIFIVSNQAGVSKGVFSKEALEDITAKMTEKIEKAGSKIEKALYCIHRAEEGCNCRKPKPGLIQDVLKRYKINPNETFFIGDTISDVACAKAARCKPILVLCGKEKQSNSNNWQPQADLVFKDLAEAVEYVVNN